MSDDSLHPAGGDPLGQTLARLAEFLPRASGRLIVDGPLGRISIEALGDTIAVDLARVPELSEVRGLFARPAGPEKAAPDPGEAREGGSKRDAASKARKKTKLFAAAVDAAGLTVEVRVAGDPLAVVGKKADPGMITRALGLGKVDLSGRTAFKLARDLLA